MCGGRGAVRRGAGRTIHRGSGGTSEGLAHGAGTRPGQGSAHGEINNYSAQEGINSKGNMVALFDTNRVY